MIKLILLLVIAYLSLSDACSCKYMIGWQKQAFCNAEFAGKVKVLSDEYICGFDKCYDIEVVQQYKGNPTTLTVLETAPESAACGVTLTQGHTYFIASNPGNENNIRIGLCSLYEDWTGLSCCEMIQKAIAYRCDGVGPILVPVEEYVV